MILITKVSKVMENAVVIVDAMTGMLSSGMEPGDPAAVLAFDEMTVTTYKVGILGVFVAKFEVILRIWKII